MDFSVFSQYIIPLIVGICLAVGYVVKTSLDFIPNKYIPAICFILGIIINVFTNKEVSVEIVFAGAISGLASTGLHQTCKCLKNK